MPFILLYKDFKEAGGIAKKKSYSRDIQKTQVFLLFLFVCGIGDAYFYFYFFWDFVPGTTMESQYQYRQATTMSFVVKDKD